MTVKPEDCLKLTTSEETLIKNLETDIDKQLREQFTTATSKVKVTLAKKLNERVFNKINAMYSLVGWQVVQGCGGGHDMRGTDPAYEFLEFSKASTPTVDYGRGGPYDR